MKVHLTTLGCPKNQVDSELMLGMLTEAGFPLVERAEDAECLVVNTCAFIDRAREESIDTILELAPHALRVGQPVAHSAHNARTIYMIQTNPGNVFQGTANRLSH